MIGNNPDQIQARLLRLAFLFLLLYSGVYTFTPMVRSRSPEADIPWQHWVGLGMWALITGILHRQTAVSLPDRDPYILPIGALLSGWGLLTIFRLATDLGFRQTVWLTIAGGILWLVMYRIHGLSILERYKYIWLFGGLFLTGLTLIFGTNPLGYGPRLWLGCCGIYLQPSEPLKLLLVTYLAAFLADRQLILQTITKPRISASNQMRIPLLPILAPTLLMTGIALSVMVMQRDLGAATIFLFLYACIVYLAVQQRQVLWLSTIAILFSGLLGYILFDVVRIRIDAWWNPWIDPSGRSYQIVQSIIAVANGGLLGRGPGLGNPGLVPISHSDFIFTALVEESGLLGGLGLLALYGLLAHRGLRTGLRAPDLFHRLITVGLTAYLVGQAILIIGGNLRLLPLTGVTLPFVSYGGSSLVTSFIGLLIILYVSNQANEEHPSTFTTRPYLELHAFLDVGLLAAGLMLGWWGFINRDQLLSRTDNARRFITEQYVPRGNIYDRQGIPLAETFVNSGNLTRRYNAPGLGPVLGYNNPVYGQAGLEAALDPWLRGLTGYSPLTLALEQLLYGYPPPGLDVRTTMDMELQKTAAGLFQEEDAGAIIMMDIANGDILAMVSQPGFDANVLDQEWESLIQDNKAPFLNRASMGLYPTGTSLNPFIIARAYEKTSQLSLLLDAAENDDCLKTIPSDSSLSPLSRGCTFLATTLTQLINSNEYLDLYRKLGFFQEPQIYLPALSDSEPQGLENNPDAILGLDPPLRSSPLQMAVAAGTLSAAGTKPAPREVFAIQTADDNWENQDPIQNPQPILNPSAVEETLELLQDRVLPVWQHIAVIQPVNRESPAYTWWVSGTLPLSNSIHLVIVIVLEEDNPQTAYEMGLALWNKVLYPDK